MEAAAAKLVLHDFAGVPEITQDSHRLKEAALGKAATVVQVTTDEEQLRAVASLRTLREISRAVETTRKAVKAPVLELGKKIDTIASDFLMDVAKHENRLTGLINHFQRKHLEAQREEEKQQQTTQAGVEALKDREAQLRLQGDHEAAKKVEAERLALELAAEVEAPQQLVAARPKGLVVKMRVNFQIIDPVVCIQAYPQFWKPGKNGDHENEVLKLDRMAVLDELNREDGKGVFHKSTFPEELPAKEGELVKPPGMRVFEDLKAHVR